MIGTRLRSRIWREIEEDEIARRRLERVAPVRDARYLEALAPQAVDERLGDRILVFHNQDVHASSVGLANESGIGT
jgi:hypothetical protein